MTSNEKQPVLSRDYDSELEQLKMIYNDNGKVEQSIIDLTNHSLAADVVSVVAYNTNTTGGFHAK